MNLLIRLLIAHLLGDFVFQPKSWIDDKEGRKIKSVYLYVHVVVHFALLMLIVWDINFWRQAVIITMLHLAIDIVKIYSSGKKQLWFFIDQVMHILVIIAVWYLYQKPSIDYSVFYDDKTLITALAIIIVTKPVSVVVKVIISKWAINSPATPTSAQPITPAVNPTNQPTLTNNDALQNAGEFIGIIERILTVTLILIGQWAAIGFLITAKSVFRFGDLRNANDRKLTEYVLIGTLLSFGIAIIIGVIINQILLVI